jgi:hypothetical protein
LANEKPNSPTTESTSGREREPDAIYQNQRLVARVVGEEIDPPAKAIRFAEVYNSDELLLPEECDFQKYRIVVQRVAYASRIDKEAPQKGRILRGVMAEILGYREQ